VPPPVPARVLKSEERERRVLEVGVKATRTSVQRETALKIAKSAREVMDMASKVNAKSSLKGYMR